MRASQGLGIAALTAMVGGMAIFGWQPPIGALGKSEPSKPDPRWIDDAKLKNALGGFIKANGLNCPAAKLAYREGPDPYGNVIKVWCGPKGTDGVNTNLVFRVTWPENGLPSVRPWD